MDATHLLGLNPSRPAPAPRVIVAVDWHVWHLQLVLAEEYEHHAAIEMALGTCELPPPTKRGRKEEGT